MTYKYMQDELISSLKEKNKVKKNIISDIITTAKNMAINNGDKDNITDDIIVAAILKAKKSCQEQIDTCPSDRSDLMNLYKKNMEYINEYAPKMLSEDETYAEVKKLLSGTENINKGQAMKIVMPALKGKADGKLINKIVTDFLKSK